MGMVVAFPADALQRRTVETDMPRTERMGTVLILPAIRIERHDGDLLGGGGSEQGSPTRRGRKRRTRS
jgi:hypothetical protein